MVFLYFGLMLIGGLIAIASVIVLVQDGKKNNWTATNIIVDSLFLSLGMSMFVAGAIALAK